MTAVIYTHSHLDHFGAVLGVADAGTTVPIAAPNISWTGGLGERVRRYRDAAPRLCYAGTSLPVAVTARADIGLGSATSAGTGGPLAPTLEITHTGQKETLDEARIIFQITPGTEARRGRGNIVRLLTQQRDLYAFLHDQTLRLRNQG